MTHDTGCGHMLESSQFFSIVFYSILFYHDINKHRSLALFQNQSKPSDSLGKIHEHIHKVYHQNVPYVTTEFRIL